MTAVHVDSMPLAGVAHQNGTVLRRDPRTSALDPDCRAHEVDKRSWPTRTGPERMRRSGTGASLARGSRAARRAPTGIERGRRSALRPVMPTLRILLLTVLLAAAVRADEPRPAPRLKFGIQTPNQETTWDDVRRAWREAEALGFDSAWLYDHFAPIFGDEDEACLEGWTLLSALAAETSRIRIGVLVTGNTYRNPAILAKMATTVDHVSGGRLLLGIGAGWFEREHQAYGIHFGTAKERAERLDEALQVITKLFAEDHPTFRGRYYTLDRAPFAPRPVQRPRPPIVVGGKGERWIVPLVARWGDAWNVPTGVDADSIRRRRKIIAEECARIGRADCPTEVSVLVPLVAITDVPLAGPVVRLGARFMVGSDIASSVIADGPAAIRDRLRELAAAGATEVILSLRPPFDGALLRRFAEEVMPAFRTAAAH